jgi:hypothetical protein
MSNSIARLRRTMTKNSDRMQLARVKEHTHEQVNICHYLKVNSALMNECNQIRAQIISRINQNNRE